MRSRSGWVVVAAVLLAAACGGDGDGTAQGKNPPPPESESTSDTAPTSPDATDDAADTSTPSAADSPSAGDDAATATQDPASGTVVTTGPSPFGEMLFDQGRQAIYLFEPEADGTPACYGACATAWPPVLTDDEPRAGGDVRNRMLGTVERRDGSTQVTYNGWPLYFYAHEGPGEVLCHDVFLNGGLWLAIGPDGRALPT